MIALDRQGTQQQRPESPAVTPPGMRVNTRYVNSIKAILVSPTVLEMEGTYVTGGILLLFFFFFCRCRQFRCLLLCPLSVERYYFPLFGEITLGVSCWLLERNHRRTLCSTDSRILTVFKLHKSFRAAVATRSGHYCHMYTTLGQPICYENSHQSLLQRNAM